MSHNDNPADPGADKPQVRAAYGQLPAEEPPDSLDRAIRAEAAAAVAAWRPRWLAPVALAATALLSFGLVMRLALPPQPPDADSSAAPADPGPVRLQDRAARQSAKSESAEPAQAASATGALTTAEPRLVTQQMDEPGRVETRPRRTDDQLPRAGQPVPAAAPPSVALETESFSNALRARSAESVANASLNAEIVATDAAAAPGCKPSQRVDQLTWIACMRTLKASEDPALERELQTWRVEHPTTALPDDLTDLD